MKGVNPGFLVLAFSTRTFESSGVPARRVQAGDMLPLACSTPACPGLLVVVGFSCGPPLLLFGVMLSLLLARITSSLSFTVLACSTSGSGRGSWLL